MYKVVIADDEVLIRMYIREILENNGFEIVGWTGCHHGLQAEASGFCDHGCEYAGDDRA